MKKIYLLITALFVAELLVGLTGIMNFPTYIVDEQIGYIPKPNQKGTFLLHNSWAFNDRSMGTAEAWDPAKKPNILLIGNSIVMGGNVFDQNDKLAPLLQKNLGNDYSVWPIAAGGWTNVNETVYLNRNPDVVQSTYYFIWEYMSGGLSSRSEWRGEYVFPSYKQIFASWYAFRRYVLPRVIPINMNELPPVGTVNPRYLNDFQSAVAKLSGAAKSKGRGLLFLYPKKAEYRQAMQGREWLPERPDLENIAHANELRIIDVSKAPQWNENLYREDGVHPTIQGNVVLAKILATAMKEKQ